MGEVEQFLGRTVRDNSFSEGARRKEKLDFSNPGHIKLSALSRGINIGDGSILSSRQFAENQFPYGYSSNLVRQIRTIPGEFVLPQDVYVGMNLRETSPWGFTVQEGRPYLTYEGKTVSSVDFVPRPEYYGTELSNGQLAEQVGPLYGSRYTLSYFLRGGCYYFAVDKACKFCSLNPTRKDLGLKIKLM